MPIRTPLQDRPSHSELVFGVVAAVGAPLDSLEGILSDALKLYGYGMEVHRLSALLAAIPPPALNTTLIDEPEYARITTRMDAGNEVRERSGNGAALALYAVSKIHQSRPISSPGGEPVPLFSRAHVLFTLKHPDEVHALRGIYGPGFFLIGVHASERDRVKYLQTRKGIEPTDATRLIARDQSDARKLGQRVRDTFHLADVFVRTGEQMHDDVQRFVHLVFGSPLVYPTPDEHAMFLAYAASLRSADLSRQVGAVVLNVDGDVIATGCNDVPRFGGGQYSSVGGEDHRDYAWGYDSNAKEIAEIAKDTIERLATASPLSDVEICARLRDGRLYDLTEFGRSVHAEMEALSCCARSGVSPRRGSLFTTTFPCHNCAKHIVAAGITRVVYVEPYPKSLALSLHADAIQLEAESSSMGSEQDPTHKVRFCPFVGVGARRYIDLFAMKLSAGAPVERKEPDGLVRKWGPHKTGPRVPMRPMTYIERELNAVRSLDSQRPLLSTPPAGHE